MWPSISQVPLFPEIRAAEGLSRLTSELQETCFQCKISSQVFCFSVMSPFVDRNRGNEVRNCPCNQKFSCDSLWKFRGHIYYLLEFKIQPRLVKKTILSLLSFKNKHAACLFLNSLRRSQLHSKQN